MKVQIVAPEMFSTSIFFKKRMELVSLPHFVFDFSRKLFLMLYSTDFEIYLRFLIEPFPHMTKKSEQKF